MKKALFLYNPQSGRGHIKQSITNITTIFRAYGYELLPCEIEFSENPFDGNGDVDLVVVAGGDGTVNFALNAMRRLGLDIPMGIIPAGTANDFAHALGMAHDPLVAAKQIASGRVEKVDCGRVNDRYFVNVLSFGLFTTTSQHTSDERKHRFGKLAYIAEGLKELRTMHSIPLRVTADGSSFTIEALMVLVFNGETAGGFHLARRASVQDGKFDCLILEKRNIVSSAFTMIRFLLGGNPKCVKQISASRIGIDSPLAEPTDVDGQQGSAFPLEVECMKGALRVMCPMSEK